jgi:hypothetical protein
MADLATQNAQDGLTGVSFTAANAGGDTVEAGSGGAGWDLAVILMVNNLAGAAARTVTVTGLPAVIVPNGQIGLIPVRSIYRGTRLAVTYSAVTSLTVAAVQLAPKLVP